MSNEELALRIQQGERNKLGELWGQVEKFVSMRAGKMARHWAASAESRKRTCIRPVSWPWWRRWRPTTRGPGPLSSTGWRCT